jgi:uncharacterized protein involved in exopolysaccharide biosynthesis
MAAIEDRVATLEREVASPKARVGATEDDLKNIPDLIRTEFRLTNSQIARLTMEVGQLRELPSKFNALQLKFDELEAKVDALPRIVAELVAERDRRR